MLLYKKLLLVTFGTSLIHKNIYNLSSKLLKYFGLPEDDRKSRNLLGGLLYDCIFLCNFYTVVGINIVKFSRIFSL